MDTPLISVILTAYNRKEFISDAIDSVINQQVSNFRYELVVLKNFSDEKIDKKIESARGVSLLIDNCSVGTMLYRGINKAKGDLILFLDDDDRFEPHKLIFIYDLFKSNPDLIFVHNSQIFVDKDGCPIQALTSPLFEDFYFTSNSYGVRKMLRKFPIQDLGKLYFNLSSISIRKLPYLSFLEDLKLMNGHTDDFFFYTGLSFDDGEQMYFSTKKLTTFRIHESTSQILSVNVGERKIKALLDFISSTKVICEAIKGSRWYDLAFYKYFSESFDVAIFTGNFEKLREEMGDSKSSIYFILKWLRIFPYNSFFYALRRYVHARIEIFLRNKYLRLS